MTAKERDENMLNLFETLLKIYFMSVFFQCFIKTCTGYLAKESTNKYYQERKRYSIWKNEKIYSHYSNELMIDT
jgi:hypothetical protein